MGILASLFFCALAFSGTLTPSGSKDEYKTYTLEGIYQRLDSGAAGTKTVFAEPTSNESTGHTVNQIMDKAPKVDAANGAGASDVGQGKTFWGLKSGAGWGLLTGSLEANTGSPLSLNDTTTDVSAGYYIEIDLKKSDSDLSADNIKKGVTIFGVTGTYENINTKASVPKTGQKTCWQMNVVNGTAIVNCGDANHVAITASQDGKIQAGVAWPNTRFVDNGNGTVKDNLTGLVWLKEAGCGGEKKWEAAVNWAKALLSGQCRLSDNSNAGDWSLPNIKEFQSIMDYSGGIGNPPSGKFSGDMGVSYWSSTMYHTDLLKAWRVVNGIQDYKSIDSLHFAWAVKR